MNRSLLLLVPCLLPFLAGCPEDPVDPGGANPDKLYLALDGSELQVRLIGLEPPYF